MTQILTKLYEAVKLSRLDGLTPTQVANAFLANYVAALAILRLQDLSSLRLINDYDHSKLTKFSDGMSSLNFWALALFYPKQKDVVQYLPDQTVKSLEPLSRKISDSRIHKIMAVPGLNPEAIDWKETLHALYLVKERYDVSSSYFDKAASGLLHWKDLSDVQQHRIIQVIFSYLQQVDEHGVMLEKFRELSEKKPSSVAQKSVRLKEDGEGAAGGGGVVATGTSAANIGSNQGGIGSGNMITRPNCEKPTDFGQIDKFKKPKKKDFETKGGKIIKKRLKQFKLRRFKDPALSKTLGDYSHVKV